MSARSKDTKSSSDPTQMSSKTYKKAVAKQRRIKRLRQMKMKDRQGDVPVGSDISDVECHDGKTVQEESQDNWLNDLVKTDAKKSISSTIVSNSNFFLPLIRIERNPTLFEKISDFLKSHPIIFGGALVSLLVGVWIKLKFQ